MQPSAEGKIGSKSSKPCSRNEEVSVLSSSSGSSASACHNGQLSWTRANQDCCVASRTCLFFFLSLAKLSLLTFAFTAKGGLGPVHVLAPRNLTVALFSSARMDSQVVRYSAHCAL